MVQPIDRGDDGNALIEPGRGQTGAGRRRTDRRHAGNDLDARLRIAAQLVVQVQKRAVKERIALRDPGGRLAAAQLGNDVRRGPLIGVLVQGAVARHAQRHRAELLLRQAERLDDPPNETGPAPRARRQEDPIDRAEDALRFPRDQLRVAGAHADAVHDPDALVNHARPLAADLSCSSFQNATTSPTTSRAGVS